jgi:hypothetical protein
VILSLGAFEKVKLYKVWHLVEMTVARHPDLLESCFGPLATRKRFIAMIVTPTIAA